jgi:S-adenosylmethionine/arginine decarboxylase-like enzyme
MATLNGEPQSEPGDDGRANRREMASPLFKVLVSARFVIVSLISSILLAFAVGSAARIFLLEGPRHALLSERRQSSLRDRPEYLDKYAGNEPILPPLVARDGKKIPRTRYTSKNFDTARSSVSSSWLAKNRETGSDADTCSGEDSTTRDDDDDNEVDLQPAGEHLMVDIKNVNAVFLNSEHLLSRAMVDVVNEAELTLLSYHCHGLSPAGVSCVGVLLHNYISFHTWPVEGVITFDLCSAGSKSILPALPIIERLFGVPRTPSHPGQVVESPEYRWAHKMRGFRHHPTMSSHLFLGTDLGAVVLRILGTEYKEEVGQQTV